MTFTAFNNLRHLLAAHYDSNYWSNIAQASVTAYVWGDVAVLATSQLLSDTAEDQHAPNFLQS